MSDYLTCIKTFATLEIFHDTLEPQAITAVLGITPTRSFRRGDTHGHGERVTPYRVNTWLLSSEGSVASHDSLRHIEWLLGKVEPRHAVLLELQKQSYRMDISCYWLSKSGHGGPTLTPDIMRRLGKLELAVWFDVYFDDINDDKPSA